MLFNYINQRGDETQASTNTKSISSLTHTAEVQDDDLKHLDIKMASNRYFYLQQLKFNPALLVSVCQDVTFKTNAILDKFLWTIQQL
jgi:hypothetical protein